MPSDSHISGDLSRIREDKPCDKVPSEASSSRPSRGALEEMARRRFQDPKPIKVGNFWYLLIWQNTPGVARKRQSIQLAPASMSERQVLKIAAEKLRPVNRGVITAGSAVNFMHFVTDTYEKTVLPLLSSTVQKDLPGCNPEAPCAGLWRILFARSDAGGVANLFLRFACKGCRVSHHRESAGRFVEHSASSGGLRVLAEESISDFATPA
jgi:hypothetical protein